MKYSENIEQFLNFIRDAQMTYNASCDDEAYANTETQDILHTIELNDLGYHDFARLSKSLKNVRRERRMAKDTREILEPVIIWITKEENEKVIKSLERLLGDVRKIEKSKERLYYNQKTDVVEKTLGEKGK